MASTLHTVWLNVRRIETRVLRDAFAELSFALRENDAVRAKVHSGASHTLPPHTPGANEPLWCTPFASPTHRDRSPSRRA
jgi:hypothetical protein